MKRSREPEEPPSPTSISGSEEVDSPAPSSMEGAAAPTPKIRELDDEDGGGDGGGSSKPFRCMLHVETTTFATCEEYDSHYNKEHLNRCHECRRNFPSNHLLGLHIEECHDSFVAVKREKGEHTYSCFVEGCDRKCRDPSKRRRHMIDKHKYPENFFFDVTRSGIDGRQSLLTNYRPRRGTHSKSQGPGPTKGSSAAGEGLGVAAAQATSPTTQETAKAEADEGGGGTPPKAAAAAVEGNESPKDVEMDMDGLAQTMSSLKLVPRSIQFGRGGKGKGGFSRSH